MNMYNSRRIVFLCMVCALCCAATTLKADTPLNILFIGNSFTNGGPIPTVVQSIALDAGWASPNVTNAAVDGQSLSYHRTSATTLAHIDSGGWDYVVLQEYSTKPTDNVGPASVFKADATFLYDRVKASSPAAQIVLYETWARHEDHSIYPGTFTNRIQMQTQLNTHYHDCADNYIPTNSSAAVKTDVTVAPAGQAWHANYLDLNLMLHGGDLYHAGSLGQYLNSLAIYSTIYQSSVTGLSPQLGVSQADAAYLQTICDAVTSGTISQFTGDINNDKIINLADFGKFGLRWLDTGCGNCEGADLSGDNVVDVNDLKIMANDWMVDFSFCGHWKLDGDASDSSWFGLSSTVTSDPVWDPNGQVDGAVKLDGIDDKIKADDYAGVLGGQSRTTCAWIKTSQALAEIVTWGEFDVTGGRWVMRINSSGVLNVQVGGGTISGSSVLTDGQWHHVAAVLDNDGSPDLNEVKLYVDGLEEAVPGISVAISTSYSNKVKIGVYGSTANYFNGWLDDVRIYDRALTDPEIQTLAALGD